MVNMNMMKVAVVLGILLVPLTLMDANAEEVKVDIANGSQKADNSKFYVPARISVPVGTTVVWTNSDDAPHTITSGTPTCVGECWGLDFDSGIMRLDNVYRFTFDKPGTYNYLCSLHPWMLGQVKVGSADGTIETEVSVTTDKTAYKVGDKVNIKGNVNPIARDQPVVVEVLNPSHEQFQTDTVNVKADGVFNYNFKLEGDLAVPGSYTVKVTYSDASTESLFTVETSDKPPTPVPGQGEGADVRVTALQIRDLIIIRVKNTDDSGAGVYGISVQVPDSTIGAFKGPRDWSKPQSLVGDVRSSTQDEPIEPGGKAVFRLKVDAVGAAIDWTAYDANGNTIDQGDTRPILRK